MSVGLPIMETVLTPLAKSVLINSILINAILLGLTTAVSATDAVV